MKIFFIIFISYLLLAFSSVNAAMYSPHYRIEEDSINVGGIGEEIDVYQTGEREGNVKDSANLQQKIMASRPLWKIILLGLAGVF